MVASRVRAQFRLGAVGGFHSDAQQKPQCVRERETLATFSFLGGIVAHLISLGAGAYRPTVKAGGGKLRELAHGLPHLGSETGSFISKCVPLHPT